MLSAGDDYLLHQAVEPVRFVSTSDRNFFDRYYFMAHDCSGEVVLIFGLGAYPNLGTMDAFALVRQGNDQHVLRSSRVLGDRLDASSGPLRVEVLDGLQRLRIVIEPNESGIEADLVFEGAHPAAIEPTQNMRSRSGRVMMNVTRFGQSGYYTGYLVQPDGTRHDVSGPKWRGYRDRSWGVRPIGEAEPAGILKSSKPNYLWCYCCAQFDDFTLMLKFQDLANGKRVREESLKIWHDSSRKSEHLGRIGYELNLTDDKLYCTGGSLICDADGQALKVKIEQLLPIYLAAGTGYWDEDPDWRHGRYQGPLKTESLILPITSAGIGVPSIIESVGKFQFEGQVGYGLFEYGFMGSLPAFGLDGSGFWNGPKYQD